jgi:hypothetical protein
MCDPSAENLCLFGMCSDFWCRSFSDVAWLQTITHCCVRQLLLLKACCKCHGLLHDQLIDGDIVLFSAGCFIDVMLVPFVLQCTQVVLVCCQRVFLSFVLCPVAWPKRLLVLYMATVQRVLVTACYGDNRWLHLISPPVQQANRHPLSSATCRKSDSNLQKILRGFLYTNLC